MFIHNTKSHFNITFLNVRRFELVSMTKHMLWILVILPSPAHIAMSINCSPCTEN